MEHKEKFLDRIVHFISEIVSSKKLFFYVFSFTLIWIGWNKFSPIDRFDQPMQGYPNLVFIYTIYFGLVEGIMKVVQGQQQKMEDARKEILDQILKETHNQTKVIHNLVKIQLVLGKRTLEIIEKYSREREENELQRNKNIITQQGNEDRLTELENPTKKIE